MAPTTRNQQRQSGLQTAHSRALGGSANGVNGSGNRERSRLNGHIKFDSDDEGEMAETIFVQDHAVGLDTNVISPVETGNDALSPESSNRSKQAGDEESDDEDDAPEAVTMGSGKEAARRREEEAKKAIGAQEEAARQKRKRREAVIKEQKEDARKRRKIAPSELAAATDHFTNGEDTMVPGEGTSTVSEQRVATVSKTKPPTLLPESLLERISGRPSPPPPGIHMRDFGLEDGDSEVDCGPDDFDGNLALVPSGKSKKKRLARKSKMEFKKGPVSVKVLKEDIRTRKILMPPADKKVVNTKNVWLSGRGQVKRRSIGGGLGGAFGS